MSKLEMGNEEGVEDRREDQLGARTRPSPVRQSLRTQAPVRPRLLVGLPHRIRVVQAVAVRRHRHLLPRRRRLGVHQGWGLLTRKLGLTVDFDYNFASWPT